MLVALEVPLAALAEVAVELDSADSRSVESLFCCDELYPPPPP